MNQGTQGHSLTRKKTEGRKSRETVPLTDHGPEHPGPVGHHHCLPLYRPVQITSDIIVNSLQATLGLK
jgi:hypothetical protein